MAACFLDTSAVVKLYVNETGSLWVHALVDPAAGNRCYLAAITPVEVVAAISRRARTGSLTLLQASQARRLFRRDCRTRLRRIRLKNAILDRAIFLVGKHPLRAYDGVQLASALSFGTELAAQGVSGPIFVCADRVLNQAALAEGLIVDDPNNHP